MKKERLINNRYSIERDALRSEGGFLRLNKKLIKTFGIIHAVVLSNYIEKDCYFNEDKPGWFFYQNEKQSEELSISLPILRKSKSFLKSIGVLISKMVNVPAKENFFIDYDRIISCINGEVEFKENTSVELGVMKPLPLEITDQRRLNISKTNIKKEYKDKKNISSRISEKMRIEEDLKNKSLIEKITPSQFDKFWGIYPKLKDKGKAKIAWDKLCKRKDAPSWRVIKTAVKEQSKSKRWETYQFIPYPATWLNGDRWLDDPKEMNDSYDEHSNKNEIDPYKEREIDSKFRTPRYREEDI